MQSLDPITVFILFSASLTAILQLVKKVFPELKNNEIVKKRLMPIIPSLIGMAFSPFLVPRMMENSDIGTSLFIGFMAGALSTSCYEMSKSLIESFMRKKIGDSENDE